MYRGFSEPCSGENSLRCRNDVTYRQYTPSGRGLSLDRTIIPLDYASLPQTYCQTASRNSNLKITPVQGNYIDNCSSIGDINASRVDVHHYTGVPSAGYHGPQADPHGNAATNQGEIQLIPSGKKRHFNTSICCTNGNLSTTETSRSMYGHEATYSTNLPKDPDRNSHVSLNRTVGKCDILPMRGNSWGNVWSTTQTPQQTSESCSKSNTLSRDLARQEERTMKRNPGLNKPDLTSPMDVDDNEFSNISLTIKVPTRKLDENLELLKPLFTKLQGNTMLNSLTVQNSLDTNCPDRNPLTVQNSLDTNCPDRNLLTVQNFLDTNCPDRNPLIFQNSLDTNCPDKHPLTIQNSLDTNCSDRHPCPTNVRNDRRFEYVEGEVNDDDYYIASKLPMNKGFAHQRIEPQYWHHGIPIDGNIKDNPNSNSFVTNNRNSNSPDYLEGYTEKLSYMLKSKTDQIQYDLDGYSVDSFNRNLQHNDADDVTFVPDMDDLAASIHIAADNTAVTKDTEHVGGVPDTGGGEPCSAAGVKAKKGSIKRKRKSLYFCLPKKRRNDLPRLTNVKRHDTIQRHVKDLKQSDLRNKNMDKAEQGVRNKSSSRKTSFNIDIPKQGGLSTTNFHPTSSKRKVGRLTETNTSRQRSTPDRMRVMTEKFKSPSGFYFTGYGASGKNRYRSRRGAEGETPVIMTTMQEAGNTSRQGDNGEGEAPIVMTTMQGANNRYRSRQGDNNNGEIPIGGKSMQATINSRTKITKETSLLEQNVECHGNQTHQGDQTTKTTSRIIPSQTDFSREIEVLKTCFKTKKKGTLRKRELFRFRSQVAKQYHLQKTRPKQGQKLTSSTENKALDPYNSTQMSRNYSEQNEWGENENQQVIEEIRVDKECMMQGSDKKHRYTSNDKHVASSTPSQCCSKTKSMSKKCLYLTAPPDGMDNTSKTSSKRKKCLYSNGPDNPDVADQGKEDKSLVRNQEHSQKMSQSQVGDAGAKNKRLVTQTELKESPKGGVPADVTEEKKWKLKRQCCHCLTWYAGSYFYTHKKACIRRQAYRKRLHTKLRTVSKKSNVSRSILEKSRASRSILEKLTVSRSISEKLTVSRSISEKLNVSRSILEKSNVSRHFKNKEFRKSITKGVDGNTWLTRRPWRQCFMCPYCNYEAQQSFQLVRHLGLHRGNQEGVRCDLCDVNFRTVQSMRHWHTYFNIFHIKPLETKSMVTTAKRLGAEYDGGSNRRSLKPKCVSSMIHPGDDVSSFRKTIKGLSQEMQAGETKENIKIMKGNNKVGEQCSTRQESAEVTGSSSVDGIKMLDAFSLLDRIPDHVGSKLDAFPLLTKIPDHIGSKIVVYGHHSWDVFEKSESGTFVKMTNYVIEIDNALDDCTKNGSPELLDSPDIVSGERNDKIDVPDSIDIAREGGNGNNDVLEEGMKLVKNFPEDSFIEGADRNVFINKYPEDILDEGANMNALINSCSAYVSGSYKSNEFGLKAQHPDVSWTAFTEALKTNTIQKNCSDSLQMEGDCISDGLDGIAEGFNQSKKHVLSNSHSKDDAVKNGVDELGGTVTLQECSREEITNEHIKCTNCSNTIESREGITNVRNKGISIVTNIGEITNVRSIREGITNVRDTGERITNVRNRGISTGRNIGEITNVRSIREGITNVRDIGERITNVRNRGISTGRNIGEITNVRSFREGITNVRDIGEGITNVRNIREGIDNAREGITQMGDIGEGITNVGDAREGFTNVGYIGEGITDVRTIGNRITDVRDSREGITNVGDSAEGITNVRTIGEGITNVGDIRARITENNGEVGKTNEDYRCNSETNRAEDMESVMEGGICAGKDINTENMDKTREMRIYLLNSVTNGAGDIETKMENSGYLGTLHCSGRMAKECITTEKELEGDEMTNDTEDPELLCKSDSLELYQLINLSLNSSDDLLGQIHGETGDSGGDMLGQIHRETGDSSGDMLGQINDETGDISGDMLGQIHGETGDSSGDMLGQIHDETGDSGGDVLGQINGETGDSSGDMLGQINDETGDISGDMLGQIHGETGDSSGDMLGQIHDETGDSGGDVLGQINGKTGDSSGDLLGQIHGETGDSGGDMLGQIHGETGDSSGDMLGQIHGETGDGGGDMLGQINGETGDSGGDMLGQIHGETVEMPDITDMSTDSTEPGNGRYTSEKMSEFAGVISNAIRVADMTDTMDASPPDITNTFIGEHDGKCFWDFDDEGPTVPTECEDGAGTEKNKHSSQRKGSGDTSHHNSRNWAGNSSWNGKGGNQHGGGGDDRDNNNNDGNDKQNLGEIKDAELFSCLVCETCFSKKTDLMKHLSRIHRLTNLCALCYFKRSEIQRFSNPVTLRNHKVRDHRQDMVQCTCGTLLIDQKMLDSHLKKFKCGTDLVDNSSTGVMMRCECGKRFVNEQLLTSHRLSKCRRRSSSLDRDQTEPSQTKQGQTKYGIEKVKPSATVTYSEVLADSNNNEQSNNNNLSSCEHIAEHDNVNVSNSGDDAKTLMGICNDNYRKNMASLRSTNTNLTEIHKNTRSKGSSVDKVAPVTADINMNMMAVKGEQQQQYSFVYNCNNSTFSDKVFAQVNKLPIVNPLSEALTGKSEIMGGIQKKGASSKSKETKTSEEAVKTKKADGPKKKGKKVAKPDSEGRYPCKVCRRRFKRPYLYVHQKQVHQRKQWVLAEPKSEVRQKKYKCKWCNFVSIYWRTIINHHYRIHQEMEVDIVPVFNN